MSRLLILGGTQEARVLAERLAGALTKDRRHEAIISLAGVTRQPRAQALATRVGGFGGPAGLVRYLQTHHIDCIIDATHPFATQMSAHAAMAARQTNCPLWRLERPAWQATPGTSWHTVADDQAAARALTGYGRTVFLTVGARSLAAFTTVTNKRWLIRSIEAPAAGPWLSDATFVQARPPFSVADETALLRRYAVDVLVTKNSGAPALTAKLIAAQRLGVPVLMIERPPLAIPDRLFATADAVLAALSVHQ